LGLAVLTRSNAVLYLLVLVLVLAGRRNWRAAMVLGGAAVTTVVLGLLPFLLADRADVIFSLVTFHGALPVSGGSLWALAIGSPYEALGQHADTLFVLAAAAVIGIVVVLARGDLMPSTGDVYGLLALAGLAFPLFIKTVWPYYFLDSYIFIAVWWLGSGPARMTARGWLGLLLPAYFVAGTVLAEYGSEHFEDLTTMVRESLVETVLVLGFILMFGAWLIQRRSQAPRQPAPSPRLGPTTPRSRRASLAED
jgi:hypothetical protein